MKLLDLKLFCWIFDRKQISVLVWYLLFGRGRYTTYVKTNVFCLHKIAANKQRHCIQPPSCQTWAGGRPPYAVKKYHIIFIMWYFAGFICFFSSYIIANGFVSVNCFQPLPHFCPVSERKCGIFFGAEGRLYLAWPAARVKKYHIINIMS